MPAKARVKSSKVRLEDSDSEGQDADSDMAGFGEETKHFFEEDSDEPDEVETFSNTDRRLRLRPEIVLEGAEYAGKKSSRKDAFDGMDEEELSSDEKEQRQDKLSSFDDMDYEDESLQRDSEVVDEDLEAVNREYEELQKEEEEMLKTLRGQNDNDAQKGEAVSHQKELWDKALETRIALQKLITGANRLPEEKTKDTLLSSTNEVQKAYEMLTSSAFQTLDCLMDLDNALVEQNGAILEAQAKESSGEEHKETSKKGLDSAWDRLNFCYSRLIPYRNNALDRWHRKTQISSGSAVSKGKLKAFNQSISQQVATAMKDSSRLIARMLTKCSDPVLGQVLKPTQIQVVDDGGQQDDTIISSEAAPNATNKVEGKVEADSFDDSEFYQQLLREFLESSDPNALGTMNHDAIRKLRNKKRKAVDRKASKGRKIRYTVHEPLVNFMAPEPMSLPPMATKLFTSLFGSRSTNTHVGQEAAA